MPDTMYKKLIKPLIFLAGVSQTFTIIIILNIIIIFKYTQILPIIIWQGKSEHSDWFFLGQDFAVLTVSVVIIYKQQFLQPDWLRTCQLISN